MMGIDLSSEPALRASTASPHSSNNFIFRNKAGEVEDIYKIYADHGVTYVRARVWNDPYYRGETLRPPTSGSLGPADQYQPNHYLYGDGYGPGTYGGGNNNIDTAVEMGLRSTQYGMKLLVDFHYSDTWTDPGRNYAPKAWNSMNIAQKRQALYDFTFESLEKLVLNGVDVGMVQIGNETQGRLSGETSAANF
jgi:arabinogalactan endo-1,4-beta-galactosidase